MTAVILIMALLICGNFVCFHVCLMQEKKIRKLKVDIDVLRSDMEIMKYENFI
jgi:hypothetical protein